MKTLPGFESFWSAFGYKIARATAYKAWVKGHCEDIADEIIAAIPAYKAHLALNPWKAQMHASTFINQERWQDEYPENKPKPFAVRSSANYGNPEPVEPPREKTAEEKERVRLAVQAIKDAAQAVRA